MAECPPRARPRGCAALAPGTLPGPCQAEMQWMSGPLLTPCSVSPVACEGRVLIPGSSTQTLRRSVFGELLEATQPATAELGSGCSPCARRRLCLSTLGGLAASVFLLWTVCLS